MISLCIVDLQYDPMLLENALKYSRWTIMLLVLVFLRKFVDNCKKIKKINTDHHLPFFFYSNICHLVSTSWD